MKEIKGPMLKMGFFCVICVLVDMFTMNLQNESANDVPKLLHPYDRASEALFSVGLRFKSPF